MNKEYRKLSELKNWDKNPRSIKEKDFERLKKHITDHGQMQPLVITQDGEVLGGNMRLRVYEDLGLTDIWVEVVEPRDEADKLRIALVLNDRAGYYDGELLANLIPDYPEFNWDDYAVDIKEPQTLQRLIDSLAFIEEDEVPEVFEGEAESKLGEVYQLGRHRLMCGDSTKIEDVEKLMNGQKAEIVLTSPPYWVGKDYEQEKGADEIRVHIEKATEAMVNFVVDNARIIINTMAVRTIKENEVVEVNLLLDWWQDYFKKLGWYLRGIRIWNKSGGFTGIGPNADLEDMNWEFLASFYKPPFIRHQNKIGKDGPAGVWTFENTSDTRNVHSATYPIELPARFIKLYTQDDDLIYEPYGGSGTNIIACEQLDRTCYAMEVDPKYCDVIRKRFDNFVKKE